MNTLLEARHLTISILRAPKDVYAFITNPENLPRWASGLASQVENVNGEWIAHSPMGQIKIRFAPPNDLGVVDHDVVLPSGATIHNPMRVLPNGAGSEVTFTVFRQPDKTLEQFEADASWVQKDLTTLKHILEH